MRADIFRCILFFFMVYSLRKARDNSDKIEIEFLLFGGRPARSAELDK